MCQHLTYCLLEHATAAATIVDGQGSHKPGIVREFCKPGKVREFEIWSGNFL